MNFLESYDRRVENDLLASSDLLETQQILLHICCGSYISNFPEKEQQLSRWRVKSVGLVSTSTHLVPCYPWKLVFLRFNRFLLLIHMHLHSKNFLAFEVKGGNFIM